MQSVQNRRLREPPGLVYLSTEYFAAKKPSFSEKLGFYYPNLFCGLVVYPCEE